MRKSAQAQLIWSCRPYEGAPKVNGRTITISKIPGSRGTAQKVETGAPLLMMCKSRWTDCVDPDQPSPLQFCLSCRSLFLNF